MKPRIFAAIIASGAIGLGAAFAHQNESAPAPTPEAEASQAPAVPDNASAPAPEDSQPKRPSAPPAPRKATPMKERVAVLGLLNKRNGLWRDLKLRPGQAVRVGDVIVRLRACEASAPWEEQKLTGAFVQTDVRGTDGKWRRVFSDWLFKESPSLNVVEHKVYDVWPKSCTMRWPEMGPDTVSATSSSPSRSSAPKSGDAESVPAEMPSAESSNPT